MAAKKKKRRKPGLSINETSHVVAIRLDHHTREILLKQAGPVALGTYLRESLVAVAKKLARKST